MTLEELAAQLREEEQRAADEDATVKLAPVIRRFLGYLDLVDEIVSPDAMDEHEELIDAEEAGKMLGHGKRYMWTHAKEFRFAYRIGRSWKFSPSGIRRWLKGKAA